MNAHIARARARASGWAWTRTCEFAPMLFVRSRFIHIAAFAHASLFSRTVVLSRALAFVVVLALPFNAMAEQNDSAPQTQVRAHLDPSGSVMAGTDIKLVVDVLTTTYFTDAPNWPSLNVDDAVVSLPDEQATNLSETIDGVRWFGVSRTYRIAPQAAKTFRIPSFDITVHPGGVATPVVVKTPALSFVATVPPGAEHMTTFFATSALSATQRIAPSDGKVQVGEAVTRTITQHAAATRSMLIPPIAFGDIDGLRRSAVAPATHDIVEDRAGLVAGERTDTASYIAGRSGHVTLPAITIEWWNATAHRRETIELPAVSLTVTAAHERPIFDIPADAIGGSLRHRIVVIDRIQVVIVSLTVAAAFALVWLWPRITARYRRTLAWLRTKRHQCAESDVVAWLTLRRIARRGSIRDVIPELYRWVDRFGDRGDGMPPRLESLLATSGKDGRIIGTKVAAHYAGHRVDGADMRTDSHTDTPTDIPTDAYPDHTADTSNGTRADPHAVTRIDARALPRALFAARRRAKQTARADDTRVPPLNPF